MLHALFLLYVNSRFLPAHETLWRKVKLTGVCFLGWQHVKISKLAIILISFQNRF